MENQQNENREELERIEQEEKMRIEARQKIEREKGISQKSRLATALFAWFLGYFGVHRFYLGKTKTGILMVLTLGGFGVWALIDAIVAIAGLMKDKEGLKIEKW